MKNRNEYTPNEKIELNTRYRIEGEGAHGGETALKWYKKGLEFGNISEDYDRKNYEYYYDFQKHDKEYEEKGFENFEKAAECFANSAMLDNELAMMNYALYLFSFKGDNEEALRWFLKASNKGLAVADYELAVFYKKGYCGVEIDEEKAEYYFNRYKTLTEADERQFILACGIDDDWCVLGRMFTFTWFCGGIEPAISDTPRAKPSKWRSAKS